MFNLQGSELVIILLLALVVLGPEKLPDAMRKAGQFFAELKKMSAGFQSEFKAAVDEPMREIRDTANTLRDSADFTKLQEGERDEKPKTAEMAPADPTQLPGEEIPTFEPAADVSAQESAPSTVDGSKPAPFSGNSSAAPREPGGTEPAEDPSTEPVPAKPAPFTGNSSAAPRPRPARPESDPVGGGDEQVGVRSAESAHQVADAFGAVPARNDPAVDVDEQPPA